MSDLTAAHRSRRGASPGGRPSGRSPRRRHARLVIAAAVVALVLGAPLANGVASTLRTSTKPVSGGTFIYALDGSQVTFDPGVSQAAVTGLIDRNIFDSLVVQTGPNTFGPWLAKRWTISSNGEVYTFYLRSGVKFQDGTPFNAAAVQATLEHIANPASKSAYALSLITPYVSSSVVNNLTIQITLSRRFNPLLEALSTPYLGIQSPTELAKPAASYIPVGTGPFEYVSGAATGPLIDLARNSDYTSPPANATHTGNAYLRNLDFDLISEDATRYGALTSGQVQGIADVPAIDVATLKHTSGFQVQSDLVPGLNYMLYFNSSKGPLSDVNVRRALSAAIDVKALIKSLYYGQYPAAYNPLSPTTADYSGAAAKSEATYNPGEAEKLLDEAGWSTTNAAGYREKDGQQLTLVWPYWAPLIVQDRDVLAEAIQAEAKQVGIDIDYESVPAGTLISDLGSGDFDICDAAFARPSPDALRFAFNSAETYTKGGANVGDVASWQIDAWTNNAASTLNPAVAKRDYPKAEAYVLAQAYVLPLYTPDKISGYAANVHGVSNDVQAYPLFYGAWLGS